MTLQHMTLTGLVIYLGALILIGLIGGRKQDHEGYVIGNRNVGILPTAMSLGAGFRDAAYVVFWISFSYSFGYAPLIYYFVAIIVTILFARYMAPQILEKSRIRYYVTIGQMLQDEVGPWARKICSAVILLVAVIFSAAQLHLMGDLFSATLDLEREITIIGLASIVGFYLWTGGYGNVIRTDILQAFIIGLILIVPFFLPVRSEDVMDFGSLLSMSRSDNIGIIALALVTIFCSGDMWQRLFSARDTKTVQIALPLGVIFSFCMTLALVMVGLAARNVYPDAEAATLFYHFFDNPVVSPVILSAMLVVLFSMAISTLDTQTYLFSSTLIRDFIHVRTESERDSYIRLTRLSTVLLLVIMTVVALYAKDLISLLMGLLSVYAVPGVLYLIAAFGLTKSNKRDDIVLSLISLVGIALFIWMFATDLTAKGFLQSITPCLVTAAGSILYLITVKFSRFNGAPGGI